MEESPNYYAVIPANVRYDEDLKANAKLLYGEITALTYKTGICYASNNYFAKLYKVDASAISRWVKNLQNKNYITVDYIKENNQIVRREIKIVGIDKYQYVLPKEQEGYCQKVKENNTSINNKETNNINIISKERFKKPTLEEVREYCEERNNNISAEQFIDFYESKGWMVGKNKMKDWKACIRTWEKRATKSVVVETIPGWFDKEQDIKIMTKQEEEQIESILNEMAV